MIDFEDLARKIVEHVVGDDDHGTRYLPGSDSDLSEEENVFVETIIAGRRRVIEATEVARIKAWKASPEHRRRMRRIADEKAAEAVLSLSRVRP